MSDLLPVLLLSTCQQERLRENRKTPLSFFTRKAVLARSWHQCIYHGCSISEGGEVLQPSAAAKCRRECLLFSCFEESTQTAIPAASSRSTGVTIKVCTNLPGSGQSVETPGQQQKTSLTRQNLLCMRDATPYSSTSRIGAPHNHHMEAALEIVEMLHHGAQVWAAPWMDLKALRLSERPLH